MNRVLSAARLHLIGGQAILVPWAIMVSALLVNLAIFGSIAAKGDADDNPTTGGLFSLYAVVLVVFVQAMHKPFAFALGLSLTRRTYLLGSAIYALALSLVSGLALYVLYGIERATGGWGMNLSFFGVFDLGKGNPVIAVLGYAAPMAALITLGTLLGAITARWGTLGLYLSGLFMLTVGGVFAVITTYAEAWTDLGSWFVDQPRAALFAGYPWLLTAVFAVCTYLVARRANA